MSSAPRELTGPQALVLRVVGAGLLIATAATHLDLYLTGYRTIPTIGGLFLFQVIVAFLLGGLVLATGSRLAAAAGSLFLISTLGGYLLTVWVGLFGFQEVRTTAGIVAGIIEVLGFGILGLLALLPRQGQQAKAAAPAGSLAGRLQAGIPGSGLAAAALTVVALAVLLITVGVIGSPGQPATASGGAALKTDTIKGVKVVTDAKGLTLYWFAPDTPTKSACNGTCAAYWPPVLGKPTAGPGVTGKLGTISRTDGTLQATYNGHPLYTYLPDSPGQNNGNNITLNGGKWFEVTASG
jgi:predicted lipoprotein with Yx(FWY)xxD motif